MGRVIRFTIPGPPMGKPRMTRSDRWKQRDCVLRYRAWADLARMCAKSAGCPIDALAVARLEIVAYFAPPSDKQARIGKPHRQTPDIDNVAKAFSDAVFKRDEGLYDVAAKKYWAQVSRLEVIVTLEGDGDGGEAV